nr:MAG TPA: hypothetical protein [Caudoviricetes sp.]
MPPTKSITINFDDNITQVDYLGGQVIWTTSGESKSSIDWSDEFTCVLNEGYIIDTITTSSDITITNKTNTTFQITTENVSTGIITITSKKASSGAKIVRLINETDLQAIEITTPESGTNGTLTNEQLAVLKHSNRNYIILNKECYYLADNEHMSGYRVYSHVGYESSTYFTKCITITLSTKAWVLTQTSPQNFVSSEEIVISGNKLMLANAVSNKVNNSLQAPATAPTATELVGISTSKAQVNIELEDSLELANGHLGVKNKIVSLTQSEYDALTTKDSNTLYVIVEGGGGVVHTLTTTTPSDYLSFYINDTSVSLPQNIKNGDIIRIDSATKGVTINGTQYLDREETYNISISNQDIVVELIEGVQKHQCVVIINYTE